VSAERLRAASTGVMPYVVTRVSWLETSIRALGMRFGTAASFAGIQISVMVSPTNVATVAHVTVTAAEAPNSGTSGIEP
jgi:hypothetical protein